MWMLTKWQLQQRRILVIKRLRTCFTDTRQPLYPVTPLSPSGLVNKVVLVAGTEVNMDSMMLTSTHQTLAGYGCRYVPTLPGAETNNKLPILHSFSRWSVSYLVAGWLHCTTSNMEGGVHFVLTGISIYSRYEFAFPVRNPELSTMDLQNVLSIIIVSHTALPLIKKLTL